MTGVEQALVQQIVGTVKSAYLADICNRTKISINDTMAGVLTLLQEDYSQLMTHELLEQEDTTKKPVYNPQNPIMTVFSSVEEIPDFADITGTSYTQSQAVNISYVILHWRIKFGLAICKRNRMPEVQNM